MKKLISAGVILIVIGVVILDPTEVTRGIIAGFCVGVGLVFVAFGEQLNG